MVNVLNIVVQNDNFGFLRNIVWIILFLFISNCCIGCSDDTSATKEDGILYEVNAPSQLIVRTQPSKSSDKILSLPDKSVIHVYSVENGWAHVISNDYDGYVNADYITMLSAESRSNEVASKVDEKKSGNDLKKTGYKSLPYVVLVLALIALILMYNDEDEYLVWLLLLMSLAELAYMLCMSGHLYRFWFLEPSEVGWLMVVVNYIITFGILILQGILVFGVISDSSSGWGNGILNFIFSFFAGFSIFGLISSFDRFDIVVVGMACVFIAGLIGVLYYSLRDWTDVLKMAVVNSVVVPVFLGLLINMLMLIIFVSVALIFMRGNIGGISSNSSSSESGGLKRYVIHEDGERFDLTQMYSTSECDYSDQYGGRWEKTSSGFRRL